MKRKALALVIPALLAAGAAHAAEIYNKDGNKLDLYGKVDGLHYFSSDSSKDGDQTYLRFGFKGETQINNMLTGYGQWEYNVQANNTESSGDQAWTRLAFAGIKAGDYGSFDYGRNYGVLYDVEAWTDMLPEFGGDSYTQSDNFMTGRANGVATYRNSDFFGLVNGLNFALQYQGKNENQASHEYNPSASQEGTANGDGRDVKNSNGDGFGISSTYDLGMGVSVGAAYSSSDRTNEQTHQSTAGGDKADAWTAGVKYDANNIYLATMYSETRNMTPYGNQNGTIANKTQNFEVTAQYQFDFGLRPAISYLQSKGKDLVYGGQYSDKDLVKYMDVGATYYFNRNMSTYVDYKINLLDGNDDFYKDNGISTDNIVALGLVYQF
ncbi:porin OmpC [Klebsiella aerogenes]|uniref:Outer membrane protein N n=1 Tax=Klebsiella aerogenes (strain ATCC 13048 / DSM 30053 / CCUG 1429 / JCM 1235 / KCTC 2190 / NBRC 13534 / NCIMB 10102 / NCTC 10006 / CDC 819-56) TaxID=1028307 RepID=A0A0H3FWS1_KLEAK|nr:porin OmpC [Klebsiella aerogenes]AEG99026.1 outer membrane protein N [Klebsiella aerogenes KCTC 2190]EKZ6373225.1 porin OmpC [Klebsiella aerogenes]EMF0926704.1 porin OmpC [Klebsiella aerogenes]KLF33195.1 porin [Klebsiella aerogenes]KLF38502.1 porin [Klebsiella aerogenes]